MIRIALQSIARFAFTLWITLLFIITMIGTAEAGWYWNSFSLSTSTFTLGVSITQAISDSGQSQSPPPTTPYVDMSSAGPVIRSSGSLPPGLNIDWNQSPPLLIGTPTQNGNFTVVYNNICDNSYCHCYLNPSFTISIVSASQTITFNNPGAQNFGTTPTLAAAATSGLAVSFTSATPGVCTITSGGLLTFVTAGTCTINADQAGNGSYAAAAQVSQSFTVNPAIQTISFTSTAPTSAAVGGPTYTPTATASSGLTVALTIDSSSNTVCSISGGVVSFIGSGSCLINANQAGNTNYSAAAQVQQSFAVSKRTTTSTLTIAGTRLFGQNLTLTATIAPLSCTGTVTFKDGGTTLEAGTMISGVATYSTTSLTSGAHTLTAEYSGDATCLASTSSPDRKSTRLNSSHIPLSRMPSSA